MKSKKSEPEMRPEYDFTGARRSRYASKIPDQERREILKRSAALDAQFQFARALQHVQELEALLVASLVLAFDQSLESAGRDAAALLEGQDHAIMSRLISGTGLQQDFSVRFKELMAERSWLVHKSGLSLSPRVEEPVELASLVSRLEALKDQALALSSEVTIGLGQRLV